MSGLNTYLEEAFTYGYKTAAAGTLIEPANIPPIAGKRIMITAYGASANSALSAVNFMIPTSETTFASAAASGASVMYLSATCKGIDGGDAAVNDRLCIEGATKYLWEECSALGNSSNKLTIKGGLGAAVVAGAKIWNFGYTEETGMACDLLASNQVAAGGSADKYIENPDGLVFGKKNYPMKVTMMHTTAAAGLFHFVSGGYVTC